ncbi:MAG: hypothetical protein LBT24_02920, partial [Tannerella sp.]|nr:hypothetical protein [Tannerella sp.]
LTGFQNLLGFYNLKSGQIIKCRPMRDLSGVRSYLIRKLKHTVNKVLSHAGQPTTNLARRYCINRSL